MFYDLPTTKSRRATSFGFGEKPVIMTLATKRNARCNPPPDLYNIAGFAKINKTHKKGKSFGIDKKYYHKVFYSNKIRPQLWKEKDTIGPDHYDGFLQKINLKCSKKWSLYGKGMVFNAKCATDAPPPNSYLPGLKCIQAGGIGKIHIGLGIGKRKGFENRACRGYPGPGTY